MAWQVTPASTVYGFVQLPLYQRVNGLQIQPRLNLTVGWRVLW